MLPSLEPTGGAEQSYASVAPLLLSHGIDLHLAVFSTELQLGEALAGTGIEVTSLGTVIGSGRYLPQARALRRLMRTVRPDLVHASLHQAVVASSLATLASRTRLLVTWASTPVDASEHPSLDRRRVWLVRTLEMVCTALARARFHAVTDGVADACRRRYHVGARRVRVAERGRDSQRFVAVPAAELDVLRRSLGLGPHHRVVLAVGRIVHQKNHVALVRAFDSVAQRFPEAVLLIAGERRDAAPDLDAAIAAARHGDRVRLLGQRDDIAALLQISSMIVCSSQREGAAGALIEAMAARTPIVSTRLEGLQGVLEHGRNAVVVDTADLAEGIASVLDDPQSAQQRAEAARTDFESRFTIDRAAGALAEVYYWAAGSCG